MPSSEPTYTTNTNIQHTHTHTHTPYEDESRVQGDISASQGMAKVVSKAPEARGEEHGTDSPS